MIFRLGLEPLNYETEKPMPSVGIKTAKEVSARPRHFGQRKRIGAVWPQDWWSCKFVSGAESGGRELIAFTVRIQMLLGLHLVAVSKRGQWRRPSSGGWKMARRNYSKW
jgi:hypothetical protein